MQEKRGIQDILLWIVENVLMVAEARKPQMFKEHKDTCREADFLRAKIKTCVEDDLMGLYVYGRGGVGKSTVVSQTLTELLGKQDVEWQYRDANVHPGGLFDLLSEWRNQVIFLDDVPSLFRKQAAKQILLAAWGRGDRGRRTISNLAKDKPETFIFTGKLIAVANCELPVSDAVGGAMLSRISEIYYSPPNGHIADLMRAIAKMGYTTDKGKILKPKECKEICEFTLDQCQQMDLLNDCRDMTAHGYPYYSQWRSGSKLHWHDLLISDLQRRCEFLAYEKLLHPPKPQSKKEEMASDLEIVARIYNTYKTRAECLAAYHAETGNSRATYDRQLSKAKELGLLNSQILRLRG